LSWLDFSSAQTEFWTEMTDFLSCDERGLRTSVDIFTNVFYCFQLAPRAKIS